jgi:hypothetical protein
MSVSGPGEPGKESRVREARPGPCPGPAKGAAKRLLPADGSTLQPGVDDRHHQSRSARLVALFDKKPLVVALLDRLQHHFIAIRIDGPPSVQPRPAGDTAGGYAAPSRPDTDVAFGRDLATRPLRQPRLRQRRTLGADRTQPGCGQFCINGSPDYLLAFGKTWRRCILRADL